MGTYIKDYDAPKSCEDCDCELAYMLQCKYCTGRESDGCPLVEVKEPHGRLIDADALKMAIHETDFYLMQRNRKKCRKPNIVVSIIH